MPTWESPALVVISWQILPRDEPEPDPDRAGRVEVRCSSEGTRKTRLDLRHDAFDRHGAEGGEIWRAATDSAEGWSKFLDRVAVVAGAAPARA